MSGHCDLGRREWFPRAATRAPGNMEGGGGRGKVARGRPANGGREAAVVRASRSDRARASSRPEVYHGSRTNVSHSRHLGVARGASSRGVRGGTGLGPESPGPTTHSAMAARPACGTGCAAPAACRHPIPSCSMAPRSRPSSRGSSSCPSRPGGRLRPAVRSVHGSTRPQRDSLTAMRRDLRAAFEQGDRDAGATASGGVPAADRGPRAAPGHLRRDPPADAGEGPMEAVPALAGRSAQAGREGPQGAAPATCVTGDAATPQ